MKGFVVGLLVAACLFGAFESFAGGPEGDDRPIVAWEKFAINGGSDLGAYLGLCRSFGEYTLLTNSPARNSEMMAQHAVRRAEIELMLARTETAAEHFLNKMRRADESWTELCARHKREAAEGGK